MHEFASEFLTFLERREEKLLSWGFHDIQYSEANMQHALDNEAPQVLKEKWDDLNKEGVTFKTFIRQLRRSNLLYQLPDAPEMYRTRMAEGVRLLANLRQMFNPDDWSTGPRLVSDIKMHLKDRLYPRRDLNPEEIWNDKLKNLCHSDTRELLKDCYDVLCQDSQGTKFRFSGFQKRSFEHIFEKYGSDKQSGSVICAGTGSGKTKAFYIPALLRVAEEIAIDPSPFTKVIAIYPRNVLLADQLREALSEAKKILPILNRPITFGALLGSSPRSNWFNPIKPGERKPHWYWEERGDGHVIPFLKSTEDGKSDLIWRTRDRESGRTCLYRLGETTPDIPNEMLRITRDDCIKNSPDILFLSIEMLNKEMGNPEWRSTFGLMQGKKAPRLVLLDEVHTYEGIPGAQVAWVLRRWKYWIRNDGIALPPHFVGLSATLKDAPEHMGRMCGIYPNQITEFAPKPDVGLDGEMEAEGQEYNIAVKGDPSSGGALLSTSIQAAMLLTRLLTPRNYVVPIPEPSIRVDRFFLKKVFGFTDNLDSLNRWLADMQNAEAMGLARLRKMPSPIPSPAILRGMRKEGQIWELSDLIGHNLSQRLDVSRCSSQDPGVNTSSDLIFATSSLEVGFDDPEVGMILHHKAPTSMSSFIQRKGRAGRVRGSRPWTVVVLSDYGRDRWAFQSAERLFNPEIDRIHVPVTNPYVLRVQLALFLVDWLGQNIDIKASPFSYLAIRSNWRANQDAQEKAIEFLKAFLRQEKQWKRFSRDALHLYFFGRGGLSWRNEADQATAICELNDIFWEEPRPLITSAIPTALRKLEVKWKQEGPSDNFLEDSGLGRPMPKSIPKATFTELDVSEARIRLEAFQHRVKEDELLPMHQFLRESCPSRVSKRFSTIVFGRQSEPGYWHEYSPMLQSGKNNVPLVNLYPENVSIDVIGDIKIYRPAFARLTHIPNDVVESSSSEWQWNTIASTRNDQYGDHLPLKGSKPWKNVFSRSTAYLHVNGTWIELLRYANNCRFELRRRKNDPIQGTLTLQNNDGTPEAVGFRLSVDGLRFEIDGNHLQKSLGNTQNILNQFRYEYFLHSIKTSLTLQESLNVFQAEWMAQISMAMLCATAIRNSISLSDAQQMLNMNRLLAVHRVLQTIFQVRGVDPTGQPEESRLTQDLLELWQDRHVVSEIERLETILWNNSLGPDYDEWVRQRYLATLAQALRMAAVTVSDQVNEGDLIVDVISSQGKHEILLTEKSSGGLGQMEIVVNKIKDDPRFFLDALKHAIEYCPRHTWANNLFAVADSVYNEYRSGSGPLVEAFNEVRNGADLSSLEKAKELLVRAMHARGMNPNRSNISAVSMKLLRPGSTSNTDILTFFLNKSWRRHSKKIGLDIPIRTFAYLVAFYPPSLRRLQKIFSRDYGETPTPNQLYTVIQQLLFEGCEDSCPDCLNHPNHFNEFGKPARNLTLPWLSLRIKEVEVNDDQIEWKTKARDALIDEGRVCLIVRIDRQNLLPKNLVPFFFEELDVRTYRESVHVSHIDRSAGYIKVTLQIRNFTDA